MPIAAPRVPSLESRNLRSKRGRPEPPVIGWWLDFVELGELAEDRGPVLEAHFYAMDAWGDPVGAGVSGARYCTMEGVAKLNTPQAPYTVANEFICGRLGLLVGLPTPPGVITRTDDDEMAYVSMRFGDKGELPPPVIPTEVVHDNPMAAAGIVVFDCWILNGDRHPGNLAYERGSLPLLMFDHSHALFGPAEGVSRLENYAGRPLVAGCLHTELSKGAELDDWCDRIAGIDGRIIRDLTEQMADIGAISADEAAKCHDLLKDRKTELRDLLREEPDKFPNVTQWGLTP